MEIKIKLSSGKEIELTRTELDELLTLVCQYPVKYGPKPFKFVPDYTVWGNGTPGVDFGPIKLL